MRCSNRVRTDLAQRRYQGHLYRGRKGESMATRQIKVERFSVTSSKSFQDVVAAVEEKIGRPDMIKFSEDVAASRSEEELEKIVHGVVGSSDLMEFTRFDQGAILRK